MLKADKMAVGKTDNSADFQPTIWRNLRRKAKPGTKILMGRWLLKAHPV